MLQGIQEIYFLKKCCSLPKVVVANSIARPLKGWGVSNLVVYRAYEYNE